MSSFYSRHTLGAWLGIIAVIAVLGYIGLSIFASSTNQDASSFTPDRVVESDGMPRENSNQQAGNETNTNSDTSPPETSPDRDVIRNGSLDLVVSDIQQAAREVRSLTEQVGGFVEDTNISEQSTGDPRGSFTIRVPADTFRDTFSQLKDIAQEVNDEQTSARDVTDQLTDLQARIDNARSTERRYVEILDQAESVDEILRVQDELSQIRGRIERLEAEKQQLNRQVAMSTINITMVSESDVEVLGVSWSPIDEIKASFNSMISGLVGFVNTLIAILFALPVYLLWAGLVIAIMAGVWKIGWWLKRHIFS